jgi:hypothetical protein
VNAAKLEIVERPVEVAESIGASLPELAVAFAAAHPAVTSVIIGPRTMEQLTDSLKGAELTLDDETLDRIDAIVPPGTDTYRYLPGGRRVAAAGTDRSGPAPTPGRPARSRLRHRADPERTGLLRVSRPVRRGRRR